MRGTLYKILGFLVWKSVVWEVRRLGGRLLPSRRVVGVATVTVVAAVVAAVAFTGRRGSD